MTRGTLAAAMTEKVCKDCASTRPISDYYVSKAGYAYPRCKACHLVRTNALRAENRDAVNERGRARYRAAPESKLAYHRLRRYGLDQDDYDALMAAQDGLCPICVLPFIVPIRQEGRWTSWDLPSIDHDHETGAVRGILHRRCNLALEFLPTDEELARARAYLAQRRSHEQVA
jgi:hypothetical protein